jgi:hypothetical protein
MDRRSPGAPFSRSFGRFRGQGFVFPGRSGAERPGNLDFIPVGDPLVPVKDDGARCRLIQQRRAVEQAVPLLAEFEGVGQNAEVCLDDEGGLFLFAPDRREEGDFAVDESKIERARRRAMFDRPILGEGDRADLDRALPPAQGA